MCLFPNKEHDASSSATVSPCWLFFFVVCFYELDASQGFTRTPVCCFSFRLFLGKHCPAAVLTTWIRSEQNAAWWKTACWREMFSWERVFFLELNKWLSSSQALVHGWCCQMGTYCCVLWVLTDLIFPNTGFCCVFCVRNGLAWLLWYGNVTTWEGDGAGTASQAGQ